MNKEKRLEVFGIEPDVNSPKLTNKALKQREEKNWRGLYHTLSRIKQLRQVHQAS